MTAQANLSEVRRKSWETRRQRYGDRGHAGAYTRPAAPCPCCAGLLPLVIQLHREGVLSEGQVATASGLSRIEIRRMADELGARTDSAPASA
ncbi:hypothetical protein FHU13_000227 [Methylobacterium sp. R2-1]|nr:hypothetical protein [Methylobacterium sp. R2-1]